MKRENIQDIYELSPVQKGILFHSLYTPELGFYFIQYTYRVNGNLNIAALEQAWQEVATRHTILRTSFYWQEIDKPLQVVNRQVKVPVEQQDWRGIDPVEQAKHLQDFLMSDRQRGFDLSQAPLFRVTVIQLADQVYEIVWSKHHLILDGWSAPIVNTEFFQTYQALCQGKNTSFPSSRPFKDYIAWLRKQDLSQAEVFWRKLLHGIKTPTPLDNIKVKNLSGQSERYDEQQIKLSTATTAKLQSLARQHQLTINTIFQAAWAILLSRYSCQEEIVYGCGVSGRPVDLLGVESMVGVFINTLPVCIKLKPQQLLPEFLKQLQAQQVEMRQYEYSPLVDIKGWSTVPRNLPLFESIVVFENYPASQISQNNEDELQILEFKGFYKTNYLLNVIGYPGSELVIGINYDCQHFDTATIIGILKDFEILLLGIADNPNKPLKNLSLLTPQQQQITSTLDKQISFNLPAYR
ncbi:condensation domain-containing protein [Nodularia sp. UHCC 0506]|uniref:condensation domain-containing protein n=1 Tax=Nodularia sp. UHCC 0506 TaxID=3110243 RepID=UPI002B1EAEB9|nr:condensation domain-containing protein [Nodularia sp. UHCC 0506]MEA5516074.1 condensation domain-containing protein [Nodularia sp. UHCC 0506]